MNYIGSKLSLLNFIEESIREVTDKKSYTFCDLFAGTGSVGVYFKKKGYTIIANDIQYYSYVLNKHYLENNDNLQFNGLVKLLPSIKKVDNKDRPKIICDYLSNIDKYKGFIYSNYCIGGTKEKEFKRQYFSDENGMRCDAIRKMIGEWKDKSIINSAEYYFLLTSLLESIDRYANTASVYGAFLKKLKKSAQRQLYIKPADIIYGNKVNKVFNYDANEISKNIKSDILYLDPPYNQRQYATNYHILETIAKNDSPKISGKTGLRDYKNQKSMYCSRLKVKKVFSELIKNANTSYIFLSYNNEGIMTQDDIIEIMSQRGEYGVFKKEHNRFKANKFSNKNANSNKTTEYLHYVVVKN
ncbi:MAG: DNA adenine methylase [Candidatus Saccharibacteria bacterium]